MFYQNRKKEKRKLLRKIKQVPIPIVIRRTLDFCFAQEEEY